MTSAETSIVWFRNDLRVRDNPALAAAAARGGPVVAVYVLDEETAGLRPLGGASRWWLHGSLERLADDLTTLNIPLVLRRGAAQAVLDDLMGSTGAGALYWNRRYDTAGIACDTAIKSDLKDRGIDAESFNGSLLADPWEIATAQGGPYKVFTPFWRALQARSGGFDTPLPLPERILSGAAGSEGDALDTWRLQPTSPDWAGGLRASWQPGEDGAREALERFLEGAVEGYGDNRDRPDIKGTSALSPHLRFGEIGPRTIWHAVMHRLASAPQTESDAMKFLSEIAWREFAYHLLFHFPTLPERNFNPKFDAFPWREPNEDLAAWQKGQTGYPIVDAGMRELWHTGYMHNRVRMVAASFLTKHLRIHWRFGEAWFRDTLVDADAASNASNWQWVAGSGADAAPYFRIFNPILQGEKFDPDGAYVRRWVRELADMPAKYIHKPWQAPAALPEGTGVKPDAAYPPPIVDHAKARQAALDAYGSLKR